jgi:DNA-binding FadR family transcriptional regulator
VGAALRGLTQCEVAEQLGMTREALRRAVARARRDGDPRAISNAPFVVREYVNWERPRDSQGLWQKTSRSGG